MPRALPDLATFVLALALAVASGSASFAGLALGFLAAWALVEVALRLGGSELRLRPWLGVLALVLVAVAPVAELGRGGAAMLRAEGLTGLGEHLRDRLALTELPALHPRLVVPNRPATYFVHAPGAGSVEVELGELTLAGEALGHGVFRVELGASEARGIEAGAGTIEAVIVVDGRRATRTMILAPALAHPRALHASPDASRACAASEESDEVLLVSAAGEPERIEVPGGPSDCGFLDDGHLVVARRFADSLLVRGDDGETRSYEVGEGATALAIDRAARRIAVLRDLGGHGELVVLEPDLLEDGDEPVLARTLLPGTPDLVAFDSTGSLLVAARSPARLERLAVRDLDGTLSRAASRALAMPAVAMTTAAGGREVVIAVAAWNEAGTPSLGNHFADDTLATLDARTLEVRRLFSTGRRSERQDHGGDVDRGLGPLGLVEDGRGGLVVAFAGSDEVVRVPGGRADAPDVETWDVAPLGASAPMGVAALAGGVLVVSSPSSGVIVVLQDAAEARTLRFAPDDATLLRTAPGALRARMGERAFYEGTRSGVSCQTCHTHGGTDGAAHNIGGRVLAPTLDTRGIGGTSPYLRDGSYPRVRDLMEVAEAEYRGYRLPAGDRGATIAGYLDALPAPRPVRSREPERERAGLDAFVRAGCPDCHAPPAFTGLGEHPIAAVFPDAEPAPDAVVLDAPSLRGVVASAPYLFDGRAETLLDVLTTHNESDRHGHTAALSEQERADLVVFLESL